MIVNFMMHGYKFLQGIHCTKESPGADWSPMSVKDRYEGEKKETYCTPQSTVAQAFPEGRSDL